MATFTGQLIKDTYEAILKTIDNGVINSTAKNLTDGVGNVTPFFVSTTQVGIGVTPSTDFHVNGSALIGGSLTITGDLTVNGTTTTISTQTLSVEDPLIILAKDNSANSVDIGFYGKYVDGSTKYAGLFRKAGDNKFHIFSGLGTEPTTTVNTSDASYVVSTLVGNLEGNVTGNIIATGAGATQIASDVRAVTQSASDNSTKIATTAYVDSAVGGVDTLAEILANGNTTGGTDIAITAGDKITNFTSTGIDDNATSNAITIDSSENVKFEQALLLGNGADTTFGPYIKDADSGDGITVFFDDRSNGGFRVYGVYAVNGAANELFTVTDQAVKLNFDNSNKLITTLTGVTVTGNVAFDGLTDTGESITITKFVDEADGIGSNDDDTSIPTSAAVKDYVDTNVTAQDLDFSGDSGTGSVDLDSQTFAVVGTANEIETSAGSQQLQIGLPSTVNVTTKLTAGGTVLQSFQLQFNNSITSTIAHNTVGKDLVFKVSNSSASDTEMMRFNAASKVTTISVGTDKCAEFGGTDGGAVELYFENSKKLETETSGVTIIGTLFADSVSSTGGATFAGNLFARRGSFGTASNFNFDLYCNGNAYINDELTVDDNATFAGNVGIGAAPVGNPGTNFLAVGTAGTTAGGIQLWAANNQQHYLQFGDANSGGEIYRGAIGYNHSSETLLFLQNSSTALSITGSQAATFAGNLSANVGSFNSPDASESILMNLVANNGNNAATFRTTASGHIFEIRSQNSGTLKLNSTSTTFTGNVNILQDNSSASDFINKNVHGTAVSRFIAQSNGTAQNAQLVSDDANGNAWVGSSTGGLNRVVFKDNTDAFYSGRNFGIGTTNPLVGLQVEASTGTTIAMSNSGTASSGSSRGDLAWFNNASSTTALIRSNAVTDNVGSNLQFYTRPAAGSLTERMRITSVGQININPDNDTSEALRVFRGTGAFASQSISIDAKGGDANIRMIATDTARSTVFYRSSDGGGNFTESMRINSSGNVGIGTDSPNIYSLSDATNILSVQATGTNQGGIIDVAASGTGYSGINLGNDTIRRGGIYTLNGSDLALYTNSTNSGTALTERMRISSAGDVAIGTVTAASTRFFVKGKDTSTSNFQILTRNSSDSNVFGARNDGTVLFGTTSAANTHAYFVVDAGTSSSQLNLGTSSTSLHTLVNFRDSTNGVTGNIQSNAGGVSFNSISDYRLKENIVTMTSALDRVSQLKPSQYNLKKHKDKTVEGFIAHELQEVFPQAVSGEKDKVNDKGEPEYQFVDNSKLVPLLVGAIQELKAEIETLKNK